MGSGSDGSTGGRSGDSGGAVQRAVVDLRDQRDPAVGHALDDVELPQRPRPVEWHAGELTHEIAERVEVSWFCKLGGEHVLGDVYGRVVVPVGLVQFERYVDQPATERRHERHAFRDDVVQTFGGEPFAASRVQQQHTNDMHRRLSGLHRQEGGIHPTQLLGHALPLTSATMRRLAIMDTKPGGVHCLRRFSGRSPACRAMPARIPAIKIMAV
jgi:hypothetical protein